MMGQGWHGLKSSGTSPALRRGGAATYIAPQFSDATESLPFVKGYALFETPKALFYRSRIVREGPKIVAGRHI